MKYQETIDFLYKQIPAFERQGASGYKPGLGTAIALDDWLGNPHRAYKCIHVAGTNGKGSVSNLLAATLQESGYRVGLFTSPHLADFRERIRVNGEMIDKRSVSRFVERYFKSGLTCEPSFFELTTAMAFEYFKQQKVDYAVIEVGLGGRLDSSNIITPILSVITNISIDHTQFLGNTLAQIASEKAGIIKPGVPVVVGEASQEEVRHVFERSARECHSPITYACDEPIVVDAVKNTDGTQTLITSTSNSYLCQLGGDYQRKNVNTVFHCINLLKKMGLNIKATAIKKALKQVREIQSQQLAGLKCDRLHMVLGFSADKDIDTVLGMMPKDAIYYFTQAQSARSMKAPDFQALGAKHGLKGECYTRVTDAYKAALRAASPSDAIFVGGSFYVLGDLFKHIATLINKQ